ncbi:hypothetical protein H2201_003511 [Coniosporium apollinis]|uniref:Uncharacterized protein n=1 Tax=Coniosporium apollinis TaxID=61459 RepID=A0ABQ9P0C4_9PEZI|nr:hypothetical protein H2201_003511 [Coniosporium apollinis]
MTSTTASPSPSTTASPSATHPTPNPRLSFRERHFHSRLSLPLSLRLTLSTSTAFTTGLFLGTLHGGRAAGLRFRAEHAHRLPTSPTGWYLYHKSKNYHVMLGGLGEGLRMGVKLGAWVGVFFVVEEAVDEMREVVGREWWGRGPGGWGRGRWEEGMGKDFLSTVVAGLTTAGAFSVWNRFPLATAARIAKTGLLAGVGFGLVQDALGMLRGREPGYVKWMRGGSRTVDT